MRDLLVLFVHLVVTTVRLMRPGGARAIVAEWLLLKQQLLIVTRSRAGHRICVHWTESLQVYAQACCRRRAYNVAQSF